MSILKKAITAIINKNPDIFFDKFRNYFNSRYLYFNELILHGLGELPVEYSDKAISYLIEDPNRNMFDYTSGNEDELHYTKKIIKKYSAYCAEDCFKKLEKTLYYFSEERALEIYKSRIKFNKENNEGVRVYWAYWGEVQGSLLSILPAERISNNTRQLIDVLKRRFNGKYTLHTNKIGHSGSVFSPLDGKIDKLNNKQWHQIITNRKVTNRYHSKWVEVKGGFVESSLEEFSMSFQTAVSNDPVRFANLLLKINKNISDVYIDSLFSGLAYGKDTNVVPVNLIEKLIHKYECNNRTFRAQSICRIISNRSDEKWSSDIFNLLKNIALYHESPEVHKTNITSAENKNMKSLDMLISNSMNCVRGAAAEAIGALLWKDKNLYNVFKDTIEIITCDENQAVKMASIECLCPTYNIDRTWTSNKIIKMFKEDFIMAGHPNSKQFIFLLYNKYKADINYVLILCFNSDDSRLSVFGAHCIAELYFRHGDFSETVFDIKSMTKEQAKGIIEMTIVYFQYEEYVERCKELLIHFFSDDKELDSIMDRLFYDKRIQLERDVEFLLLMMKSKLNRRVIHAFVNYLEENSYSLIDYNKIIFEMSESILNGENEKNDNNSYLGVCDQISKLIASLYDQVADSEEFREIQKTCLDIWDLMFEKRIGSARHLSKQLMDR